MRGKRSKLLRRVAIKMANLRESGSIPNKYIAIQAGIRIVPKRKVLHNGKPETKSYQMHTIRLNPDCMRAIYKRLKSRYLAMQV